MYFNAEDCLGKYHGIIRRHSPKHPYYTSRVTVDNRLRNTTILKRRIQANSYAVTPTRNSYRRIAVEFFFPMHWGGTETGVDRRYMISTA
jgi:hypothetical protein